MGTRKNTQFTVRPDVLDTNTINALNNELGVIVYDKDAGVLKRNNGAGWDSILASAVDAETLSHFKYNPVTSPSTVFPSISTKVLIPKILFVSIEPYWDW